jgi:hypothetical protein
VEGREGAVTRECVFSQAEEVLPRSQVKISDSARIVSLLEEHVLPQIGRSTVVRVRSNTSVTLLSPGEIAKISLYTRKLDKLLNGGDNFS